MLTDVGSIDDAVLDELSNCNGIMLEFNHDINMLEVGSYPYNTKKRIAGTHGHLSNDTAARVLSAVYHKDMEWAILAHLSSDNNLPDLAYLTAKNTLAEKGVAIGIDIEIYVAGKDKKSPILNV